MQFIYATQSTLFSYNLDVKLRESVVKYIDDKLTKIFATTSNSYTVF
jgi:hypothetical protein